MLFLGFKNICVIYIYILPRNSSSVFTNLMLMEILFKKKKTTMNNEN